jgi:hypothetical protein
MSFELVIQKAKNNKLVYQVYDYEIFLIPIGKNYFTRVRNLGSDYYVEYCDDYRKPLDDKVIVVRVRNDSPIDYATVIVNHILRHPKNKEVYRHFDECLKQLDKEYHCEVIENEAFVRPHDQTHFTKLIADNEKITVEYYTEKYVLCSSDGIAVLNDDIQIMVKYIKEIINCHPKIFNK